MEQFRRCKNVNAHGKVAHLRFAQKADYIFCGKHIVSNQNRRILKIFLQMIQLPILLSRVLKRQQSKFDQDCPGK